MKFILDIATMASESLLILKRRTAKRSRAGR